MQGSRRYALQLTPDEWTEWQRQWAGRTTPKERRRLEVVRLATWQMPVSRIAREVGIHEQTVRRWIGRFQTEGFSGLLNHHRSGRPRTLTDAHLEAAETVLKVAILRRKRVPMRWLSRWLLVNQGVQVSPEHLGAQLRARQEAEESEED